jgi:hypothetical protein
MKMRIRKIAREFKDFCSNESNNALGWSALSLTTFSILITVFIYFQSQNYLINIYFELAIAIILSSGVIFSTSWYLFSYMSDSRKVNIYLFKSSRHCLKWAEILETLGCFIYGLGIILLLFALKFKIALLIFVEVFGSLFLLTLIIQKSKVNNKK